MRDDVTVKRFGGRYMSFYFLMTVVRVKENGNYGLGGCGRACWLSACGGVRKTRR